MNVPNSAPTGPAANTPISAPNALPCHTIWAMLAAMLESHVPSLERIHQGKVRDIYAVDEQHMLIVTTDRLSAFDVVMPDPIPGKGRVLTQISNFWFERTRHIVPNHLADYPLARAVPDAAERAPLEERSMVVRAPAALPIEAVVRGYLIGSGWKDYQQTGAVCGIALPAGLRQADRLPEPIFTPATKAELGAHDENIPYERVVALIGRGLAEQVRATALALYALRRRARARARHHHRRHQVRIRRRRSRAPDADRRGADAGFVALLAGRHVSARHEPAELRQAVRARLPGDAGLGQAPARAETAARSHRADQREVRRSPAPSHQLSAGALMPRTIALIYLAFGAVWIFFTDRLLVWLHLDAGAASCACRPRRAGCSWSAPRSCCTCCCVATSAAAAMRWPRSSSRATKCARQNAELERRVWPSARGSWKRRIASSKRSLTPSRTICAHPCAACPASARSCRRPRRRVSTRNRVTTCSASTTRAMRMSSLIEDLLNLSRIGRSELTARPINLSQVAAEAAAAMRERHPKRDVQLEVAPGIGSQRGPATAAHRAGEPARATRGSTPRARRRRPCRSVCRPASTVRSTSCATTASAST